MKKERIIFNIRVRTRIAILTSSLLLPLSDQLRKKVKDELQRQRTYLGPLGMSQEALDGLKDLAAAAAVRHDNIVKTNANLP